VVEVLKLIEVEKPVQRFGRLLGFLLESGISSSDQLFLCPENVLCVIGDMGIAQARILRNYAKHIVLPVLGLQGNYEEAEITTHEAAIKKSIQIDCKVEETESEGTYEKCDVTDDDYDTDSSECLDEDDRENWAYKPSTAASRGRSLSC
jgi:hypothetical protein